jgi:CDP-glucose 4,6-dehydratase
MWAGRSVLVTGHTGFKGGWLSLLLAEHGAHVHGYALHPPTTPSFYETTTLAHRLRTSTFADIRDDQALRTVVAASRPEVVFHLAAQPLVRRSYQNPIETFDVNVLGTARLLQAFRACDTVRAVVVVTTDKCYENVESREPYRECDRLGGHDPYSASKACAELVCQSFRKSFLAAAGISVATARAGNVIGGGDWAEERLVPDFLRALDGGTRLTLRSPGAIRPWQHVLEPISGYITLAESLLQHGEAFAEAWNFGPDEEDARTVGWVADRLCGLASSASWAKSDGPQPHEARLLMLDSTKAKVRLGWRPRWPLDEALARTVEWHRLWRSGHHMAEVSVRQIATYEAASPGHAEAA